MGALPASLQPATVASSHFPWCLSAFLTPAWLTQPLPSPPPSRVPATVFSKTPTLTSPSNLCLFFPPLRCNFYLFVLLYVGLVGTNFLFSHCFLLNINLVLKLVCVCMCRFVCRCAPLCTCAEARRGRWLSSSIAFCLSLQGNSSPLT